MSIRANVRACTFCVQNLEREKARPSSTWSSAARRSVSQHVGIIVAPRGAEVRNERAYLRTRTRTFLLRCNESPASRGRQARSKAADRGVLPRRRRQRRLRRSLVTTLREKVLDLLHTNQLLHQALQRVLALRLSLLRLLKRLRQASTSRLSSRWQHRAWARLLGQQLPLKLLRLVVRHRDQLRGFHPHGSCGGSGRRSVPQLHLLLRMMAGEASLMASQRVYANVRQPAGWTARRGKVGAGVVRVLAPLGSHILGPAPPSPSGGRARGLLASLAHRGALLVLLLLTGILRSLYTCRCPTLSTLYSLKRAKL